MIKHLNLISHKGSGFLRIEGANHSFQPKGWDELIKGTTEFLKKNI